MGAPETIGREAGSTMLSSSVFLRLPSPYLEAWGREGPVSSSKGLFAGLAGFVGSGWLIKERFAVGPPSREAGLAAA